MSRSLGQLTLDLVAKTGGFTGPMDQAARKAKRSGKDMADAADQAGSAWAKLGPLITGALAGLSAGAIATSFIANTRQMEQEQAQLAAVLKSTGEAAGFSRGELNDMAAAMQNVSTFSAGEINQAQTNLLAFTGVVGKEFERAMQSIMDMSARTGMSVTSAAETIGRALDVPSAGMAALSRQGFRFTEDQKKLMQQLEATGRTAEAQGIILDALEESYAGAAAAARDTFNGALLALGNTIDGLLTGGEGTLVMAKEAVNALNDALASPQAAMAVEVLKDGVVLLSTAIAGRLVGAVGLATASFAVGQVQAYRYQMALAAMAGTSKAAATGLLAVAAAGRAANAALAMVGGPLGAAVLAAGAMYVFRDELLLSESQAKNTKQRVAELTAGIDDLNQAMLESKVAELTMKLAELEAEAVVAGDAVKDALAAPTGVSGYGSITQIAKATQNFSELNTEVDAHNEALRETERQLDKITKLQEALGNRSNDGSGSAREDRAEQRRLQSIRDQIAALELQAKQVGMTSDAIRLMNLQLAGATDAQLAQARAALDVVAAYEAQEQATKDYQTMVEALRTDEEKLTAEMRERLAILEQMKGLTDDERSRVAARIIDQGTEEAPKFAGLSPEIGGAFGELAKIKEAEAELDEWYQAQLERIAEFREDKAELNAQWDAEELSLKQQHEDKLAQIEKARQVTQLAAAESTFGNLADMAKVFAGEQSGIFKVMFAAEKAFSIARSIMAIQTGIAQAAAIPFPENLGAMASVAAATANIVTTISSVAMPQGMAHDGIDKIPQDGTWFLQKGERVTTAQTSDKLDRTLEQIRQGQQGGGVDAPSIQIEQHFHIDANAKADPQTLAAFYRVSKQAATEVIIEAQRPGGLLNK